MIGRVIQVFDDQQLKRNPLLCDFLPPLAIVEGFYLRSKHPQTRDLGHGKLSVRNGERDRSDYAQKILQARRGSEDFKDHFVNRFPRSGTLTYETLSCSTDRTYTIRILHKKFIESVHH